MNPPKKVGFICVLHHHIIATRHLEHMYGCNLSLSLTSWMNKWTSRNIFFIKGNHPCTNYYLSLPIYQRYSSILFAFFLSLSHYIKGIHPYCLLSLSLPLYQRYSSILFTFSLSLSLSLAHMEHQVFAKKAEQRFFSKVIIHLQGTNSSLLSPLLSLTRSHPVKLVQSGLEDIVQHPEDSGHERNKEREPAVIGGGLRDLRHLLHGGAGALRRQQPCSRHRAADAEPCDYGFLAPHLVQLV